MGRQILTTGFNCASPKNIQYGEKRAVIEVRTATTEHEAGDSFFFGGGEGINVYQNSAHAEQTPGLSFEGSLQFVSAQLSRYTKLTLLGYVKTACLLKLPRHGRIKI